LLLVANQEMAAELRAKVGASDLVQDTFAKAAAKLERFTGHTREELFAWLRRILLNHLANVTQAFRATDKRQLGREVSLDGRSADRDTPAELAGDDETPSAKMMAREQDEALDRALARLPEHYREILLLHSRDSLSFAEIGARLGKSAEAVRKQWSRAVEALEKLLGEGHEHA
jgi:RNA polymerase sigma-70 factor (ECF subfamily)